MSSMHKLFLYLQKHDTLVEEVSVGLYYYWAVSSEVALMKSISIYF